MKTQHKDKLQGKKTVEDGQLLTNASVIIN
jgi:hypothetical protein